MGGGNMAEYMYVSTKGDFIIPHQKKIYGEYWIPLCPSEHVCLPANII